MAYKRLGELLIASGMLDEEGLEKGLALQKETKERLGTTLISSGIITEQQMIEALQMQLGIDYVDLSKMQIPATLASAVPKNIAKQYQVVPVKVEKDNLYLAMSDPTNFYAIEEVKKSSRKKIIPVIATSAGVEHAIQVLYGNEGAAKAIEEMQREQAASGEGELQTEIGFETNVLGEDAIANAPTIRLVNSIIERAVTERASDIHIEPHETNVLVRMRIDGILHNILEVPKELQNSVTSRIKVISGLDIAERRVPQDGRFNVSVSGKSFDLRVSTLPTVYGEKIVARLLDKSGRYVSKEAIGLSGDDLKKYEQMTRARSGVILIAGPTGSGKSTTMYTMLDDFNNEEINLVTIEDPVEYNIDGVNQVQINDKTGMTFASGLRAILRQDPDVIGVGEIRDGETADIALRAAITGHVVLSTIHTNDAVGTIDRLNDIGVAPYLSASALNGVISQRLVRRICPHCKEEYEATDKELDDLGIPEKKGVKFYKGKGCPYCFNTGYHDRIAVFEMLNITRPIRNCISNNSGREAIEKILDEEGSDFVSLRENGVRLVLEGTTTYSEIMRVTSEQE